MQLRHTLIMGVVAAAVAVALSADVRLAADPGYGSSTSKSTKVSPEDPTVVGPTIYRVMLENERVRVMEARFKPGEKIAMHTHPDHVVVVTSAGKLAITNSEGTQEIEAKVGDAFFIPSETHSAQNVGTTEFICVVTELKGKYKAKGQASPKPGTIEVQQGKVDG
jgi:quercetin dioxygenase-like cupin family protein